MTSKVLLINPIGPDPPPMYFGPPYGLALIAAVLEKSEKDVRCIDFEREDFDGMIKAIKSEIRTFSPDYVGISCQSTARGFIYRILKVLNSPRRKYKIVTGGPFASLYPEILLRKGADFAIIGPGEHAMNELIDSLDIGNDAREVAGLAFLKGDNLEFTLKKSVPVNMDYLPFPAFHLFEVSKKLKENRDFLQTELGKRKSRDIKGKRCTYIPNSIMLLSSVGCVYSCSFCPMSKAEKPKYRYHSPKYFVDMIEKFMKEYNQEHFVFGDNFFTLMRSRTIEICDEIIKRKLGIEWVAMTRTDYVDQEILNKMSEAGCTEISFGVESCSKDVQESIGKGLDIDSVRNAIEGCRNAGIRSVLMLMVGNQGESDQSIRDTLIAIRDLNPDKVQIKTTKVYPGTKIHDICMDAGIIDLSYYLGDDAMPPVFTAETHADKIAKWKSMIRPRDMELEIQGVCNNSCKSCCLGDRKSDGLETQEVKNRILDLIDRCDTLTLSGGDPLMRKDIWKILDYCGRISPLKLWIRTNARMASYKSVARKITKAGVQGTRVPVYSMKEEVHDSITNAEGSLSQTLKGIDNLVASGITVLVTIPIMKENLSEIANMVDLLSGRGIKRFDLVFDPSCYTNSPTLTEAGQSVIKTLKSSGRDVKIMVNGIPYCKLEGFGRNVGDLFSPFDEIMHLDGRTFNRGRERRKNRTQKDICRECTNAAECEGFWEEPR